jgi:hypothetical protein
MIVNDQNAQSGDGKVLIYKALQTSADVLGLIARRHDDRDACVSLKSSRRRLCQRLKQTALIESPKDQPSRNRQPGPGQNEFHGCTVGRNGKPKIGTSIQAAMVRFRVAGQPARAAAWICAI